MRYSNKNEYLKTLKNKFINKATEIFGNLYDYSLVIFNGFKIPIKIICKKHNIIFEKTPSNHIYGKQGCLICKKEKTSKLKKSNTTDFIKKSEKIHGNKYDYSLVDYDNAHLEVKIICKKHNIIFKQKPHNHLSGYCGCNLCKKENKTLTKEEFIKRATKIHEDKYDYSISNFIDTKTKIDILCKVNDHGLFTLTPAQHYINKRGCPKCWKIQNRLNVIKRIESNKLNGNQLYPNFNITACKIFDKIMKKQNCYIQHAMNGGEYYIKELGYWLDGYDKENNIVYEYDEKQHFKNGQLKEKDMIRQQEIEYFLKCKFIRIKN